MLKEFGQFIMRGNVLDLAVGVIIGGAFNAIIESVVKKLITPLLGVIIGGVDFSKSSTTIAGVELGWGDVVQNIFNFLVTGFVLFMMLRAYNKATKNQAANYAPAPTPTEAFLADIKSVMEKVEANTRR
jgi:large conductance mechanosensitive channel